MASSARQDVDYHKDLSKMAYADAQAMKTCEACIEYEKENKYKSRALHIACHNESSNIVDTKTKCNADGCNKRINHCVFMCGYHWGLVPVHLQKDIYRYYRKGQEIDKNPSPDYISVANVAIRTVKERRYASAKRTG